MLFPKRAKVGQGGQSSFVRKDTQGDRKGVSWVHPSAPLPDGAVPDDDAVEDIDTDGEDDYVGFSTDSDDDGYGSDDYDFVERLD